VIPARGGSQRIAGKNIRNFAGKPMIAHAIAAAIRTKMFERIVVSTDDDEIARIAREFGAETPFKRPRELSDATTPTVPVIAHAISACEEMGWKSKMTCCIYPAVPFVRSEDFKGALELYRNTKADYSFPVVEFQAVVQRALKRDSIGKVSPFYPEYQITPTQELEPAYHDAGQFYWGSPSSWMHNPEIHSGGAGYPIPNWRVVDIDTEDDWKRAELMMYALEKKQNF